MTNPAPHPLASYKPTHKVHFITAASLFDGHDAAINIMRRISTFWYVTLALLPLVTLTIKTLAHINLNHL